MRVLVLGAGGFIGGRIAGSLLARGHDVVPCGRDGAALRRHYPGHQVVEADLAHDGVTAWLPRLAGLDAVVNAAGALSGAELEPAHTSGPIALFDACAELGIAHVVQISALGADADARSRFHLTKRAADEHVLRLRDAAASEGGRGGWCVV